MGHASCDSRQLLCLRLHRGTHQPLGIHVGGGQAPIIRPASGFLFQLGIIPLSSPPPLVLTHLRRGLPNCANWPSGPRTGLPPPAVHPLAHQRPGRRRVSQPNPGEGPQGRHWHTCWHGVRRVKQKPSSLRALATLFTETPKKGRRGIGGGHTATIAPGEMAI